MQNKFAVLLTALVVSVSGSIFSQTETFIPETFSRLRLQVGYIGSLKNQSNFKETFFNFGYRTSDFDRHSSSLKLEGAFEVGANTLLNSFDTDPVFVNFPVPYVKAGPELRLYKNLYMSGSVGITGFPQFFLAFFASANCIYLIPLTNDLLLEIEGGSHQALFIEPSSLIYFGVGISFP